MSTTPPSPPTGRLVLMPNTLDLGSGHAVDLRLVLPDGAIARAAGLRHWVVENARSARAFLKRVGALAPLAAPLQELDIRELPRPQKGADGPRSSTAHRTNAGPSAAAAIGSPADAALRALLAPALQGQDIGLLSEAGLPAVADPGSELVALAHAAGIAVEPWAGPSSLVMALAASGLGGQHFAFVGYLPVPADARAARIRELEATSQRLGQTQLAIETPYRNAALAAALIAQLQPATRLAIACGLTLPGGWCRTLTVERWRRTPPVFEDDQPAVFAWRA